MQKENECRANSIFWVPAEARWAHLKTQARQRTIGQLVDDAMAGIERDNPAPRCWSRLRCCQQNGRRVRASEE
ncbi:hypothetical protein JW998_13125 [candidate division KSB1 bacterium]|nr:hypothetical protein [candidate division KSB1 bacterium]